MLEAIGDGEAGQTRAGQMVRKPLPVLHVMFSMMGLAMVLMAKKLRAGHGAVLPVPRFLKAATQVA